jgi:aminoglycoside phosphotransferase family enzyme
MTGLRKAAQSPVRSRIAMSEATSKRNSAQPAGKAQPSRDMKLPGVEEIVAFLSKPEAYPDSAQHVETRQTHMSWVFLTNTQAWKLKKPVRTEYLDFSTPEARRLNCAREVRLNRRLAKDVYQGVVPLTVDRQGNLQLGGQREVVDWLVCMRRLPSERMLDELIARHAVAEGDVSKLASVLTDFYMQARPVPITGPQYRKRLTAHLESARRELAKMAPEPVELIMRSQFEFLRENSRLFDARVRERKIIDAHGDLRPEHICLETQPHIIDCLEFNRTLRILDAASELMFLALECERLGAPEIGKVIFRKYCEEAGDWPSSPLLAFYRAYHACIRAQIAIWHLKDEGIRDRANWIAKANRYLDLVAGAQRANVIYE